MNSRSRNFENPGIRRINFVYCEFSKSRGAGGEESGNQRAWMVGKGKNCQSSGDFQAEDGSREGSKMSAGRGRFGIRRGEGGSRSGNEGVGFNGKSGRGEAEDSASREFDERWAGCWR